MEWTVPVEDALAPAVLPLLHQADDVPLLNKTMTKLQIRTPENISLYSTSTVCFGLRNFSFMCLVVYVACWFMMKNTSFTYCKKYMKLR